MLFIVVLCAALGFVAGVIVNLLADYLPARRYHLLAKANPFGSQSIVPIIPPFLPRRPDGSRWPIPQWSGLVAALTGAAVFEPRRRMRHVLTEMGLALAFALIAAQYGTHRSLPFMLFYAAVFALVIIIDVEYRWILFETIWPAALVALAEAAFIPRVSLDNAIQGGLYGFAILFGLYLLGLVFARAMSAMTGRRVGRTVLGFGDVRMATLSGLILGWQGLGPALFIMLITGAAAALLFIANKLIRARRYRMYSAIPYGPYIVIGTAVMLYLPWLGGEMVWRFLSRL
jgi:prepilin signal peptidase PulO-like enzyme (type II secretory pathway)